MANPLNAIDAARNLYQTTNMNITQNAVGLVNKDRQQVVENKAVGIIMRITSYQASIKQSEDVIKSIQEQNAKLALDVLDYGKVVGSSAPLAPNENQATILRAIAESNKKKQDLIESQAKSMINAIETQRCNIKCVNESIALEREALAKLSFEVVSETTVTGK